MLRLANTSPSTNAPTSLTATPANPGSTAEDAWFPPFDLLEEAQAYVLKIDLPEMRPEDIQVVVDDGGLFIRGDRSSPPQEQGKYLRMERPRGHFERRLELPDDASREEIDSELERGVLQLRIRKVGVTGQNTLRVQISSPMQAQSGS